MFILFEMNSEKVLMFILVSSGLHELKNIYSWVITLGNYEYWYI